jgi:hypothetical protein
LGQVQQRTDRITRAFTRPQFNIGRQNGMITTAASK